MRNYRSACGCHGGLQRPGRSLDVVLLAGEQAVILASQEMTRGPVARRPGRPPDQVRTRPHPERSYLQGATTVMTKLCSRNLIAGCIEPDWPAPAFTDSGRRRFSTQISTQKCGKAEPKCYMS